MLENPEVKKSRSFIEILGSGTSTGVPVLTCKCRTCKSRHPRNQRLRASAWVMTQGKSFLIDTSTDLRAQAFRAQINRVDGVLYTHPHTDHTHGIDELRAYNFSQNASIPIYAHDWTSQELKSRFPYIFNPGKVEGGGIPLLTLNEFDENAPFFEACGIKIVPIPVSHGSKITVGFRFDKVAYITDCSYITPSSLDRIRNLDVLILDCLRINIHGTHFNLDQAIKTIEEVKPKKTYLTHLAHDFDYREQGRLLPNGVEFAYDGLKIRLQK